MKTARIKEWFQSHTIRFRGFDLTGDRIIGGRYIPRGDDVQDVIEVEVKTRADEPKTGSEYDPEEG